MTPLFFYGRLKLNAGFEELTFVHMDGGGTRARAQILKYMTSVVLSPLRAVQITQYVAVFQLVIQRIWPLNLRHFTCCNTKGATLLAE